ncbi:hypothetical protein [Kosakonia radicincitans]|uniref:hypothetical protein n=1 Tax=Kosakonia radicincitans TaxID=283686 RepID=UPI001D076376|nr:hypothetical protein [Kosakonia radicincitans]
MIAACYIVHLYCDCGECYPSVKSEYTGKSWTGCTKEARKDGWRISKDRERCYAPGHKIKREAL